MFTLILRAIIIYTIVLFAVRIMGKRQIGDMQPFELVVTLIIADLACIPMSDITIPIVFGIVPLFSLVVFHYFFSFLNRKSIFFRKLLNGRPIIVVDELGINYSALKKLNMTINDLTEGLRACDCFDLNDVAYAIVETNGKISVLLKSNCLPATNKDLKIKTGQSSLSLIIINDGKFIESNLEPLNIDNKTVENILKQNNIKNKKDVLLLSINNNGDVYLQQKNKPYKFFQINLKEV
ncbi:MAG: DUF421 domain-containing protein [Clostridia bacterium]|nr:DUF421 domain-containing protein [Clostridia bacterium]